MSAYTETLPDITDDERRKFDGSFFLFIISEMMIFITLFSTRFLLAYTGHPDRVNQTVGGIVTALLVFSLWPLAVGHGRISRGRPGYAFLWFVVLLGVLALAFVVYDWSTLALDVGSRYGENYVLSTGYHALHIVFGLIGVAVIAAADRRGRYQPLNHWPARAAAVFWVFVVVSWLALYVIFFWM